MQHILAQIQNAVLALKAGDTGSCFEALYKANKLGEEKFTSNMDALVALRSVVAAYDTERTIDLINAINSAREVLSLHQ
jgi:hypothetical protein